VKLLLESGAKIDATDAQGRTPLFTAALGARGKRRGAAKVVELLEQHGAVMDLNSAICLGRADWVKEHLHRNKRAVQQAPSPGQLIADMVRATDHRLMTEIEDDDLEDSEAASAIVAESREIIEMLLDRGADPNGDDGMALFTAVQFADTSIAELLLERGADPNRGLAEGRSDYLPDIANTEEMRNLLKRHGAREDPHHTRRNYNAKGYVSIWLGRFRSKRKYEEYTSDPDFREEVTDQSFTHDFGVDVFDGISYCDDFSPRPVAVDELLQGFPNSASFLASAVEKAQLAGWRSANSASLMYDFRYDLQHRKVRPDCPMTFIGAFPYVDEDRVEKYLERGDYRKGLKELNKVIELNPKSADTIRWRGYIHEKLREYALAKADYEEAVRLGGDDDCLNSLAWILATAPSSQMRDASRALELASRACRASRWRDPSSLDTLAAAYANCGQFQKAISWQEKAIRLEKDRDEKKNLREHLDLYRAGQPYRLPGAST
jgi:tetratricopeptide (TPR) repeat protein